MMRGNGHMIETRVANWIDTDETLLLPIAGEAPEALVTLISGGQPVLLVRNGRPVAVVIDLDSYQEAEALAASA